MESNHLNAEKRQLRKFKKKNIEFSISKIKFGIQDKKKTLYQFVIK